MSTIFSKIINREIPAKFVYEDDICVVIMDQFPGVKGQTLVIPKAEVDYTFSLESEIYEHIFNVAKKIALASDKAFDTSRTCLVVEGFEVPHVHIKLYPMTEDNKDLSSALKNGERAEDEQLAKLAAEIKSALQP